MHEHLAGHGLCPLRWSSLFVFASAVLAGCSSPEAPPPAPVAATATHGLVQSFPAGSLIIPMDTDRQDLGTLEAFGLVYALLSRNIPVHWAVLEGKGAGDVDFTISAPATVVNFANRTPVATPVAYRGGPFIVAASDRAAAGPIILSWQTVRPQVIVHELTSGSFSADIARTMVAAPRIAVFRDGNEQIAFTNFNAAGIPDTRGAAWSNTSPDALTSAQIVGPTTSDHADGILLSGGAPSYCHVTSMHYVPPVNTEVVAEVRSWLASGPTTHAFMQCLAVTSFENEPTYGRYITTGGLTDDGDNPANITIRVPDDPLTQLDGPFDVDFGAVDSLGLALGSSFRSGTQTLINRTGSALTSRIVWMSGNLDGNGALGKVTYLGGHNFTTATPISDNPQTNGVRLFLNSLFESPCTVATGLPVVTLVKSAPALTNASSVTFTLTYTNAGPGIAYEATLTDVIPAGTTFVSATGGGTFAAGTVTWNLGTLGAGESASVSFVVSVALDGTYSNRATLRYEAGVTPRSVLSNTTSTVRDTVAPTTSIASGPSGSVSSDTATFNFSSNDPAATFECSLDGAAFAPCPDPVTLNGLPEGSHTLLVRARDAAGNVDASPASRTWTVDTTPPSTTIVSGPSGTVASTSATFNFSSDDQAATFECSLDGAAFAACPDPATLSGLGQGSHTLLVRARDAAGNLDPTPASQTWTVDTVAPTTTIESGPSGTVDSTSATFDFSSNDPAATFECSLDGAAFAPCPDPTTLSGLSAGAHTLRVRARDAVGNVDASPASRTWTIDLTPPDTSIASGPSGAVASTSATFDFASDDLTATFECSLDGAAFAACTDPTLLTGLSQGAHTLAVRARSLGGRVDPTPATRTWIVDTVAPDTQIVSGPNSTSSSTVATFDFSSNESRVSYECSLDGAAFAPCPDPVTFTALDPGPHTLVVRAKDLAGNVDATPVTFEWTIDPTVLDTFIDAGPLTTSPSASATFEFSSNVPGATFECKLDAAATFTPCDDPLTLTNLGEGAHHLEVRARNAGGQVDATPATYDWTVDTSAPDTSIVSGPPLLSSSSQATFTFASNQQGATFECSLDGGAFSACPNPDTLTGLSDGAHSLAVRARNTAGVVDPTPAIYEWVVATTALDTAIDSGPATVTRSTQAVFNFSSNTANAIFECRLDGAAAFVPCTDPSTYTGLSDGLHVLEVRSRDLLGRVDATPAVWFWTVDTIAPDTRLDSTPPPVTPARTATFDPSSNEPGVTYECSLDGAAFSPCADPINLSGLPDGTHTLRVRAVDAAGNRDPSPVTYTWTVGAAPDGGVDAGPGVDSGPPLDAGQPVDAGVPEDSGAVEQDAAQITDTGLPAADATPEADAAPGTDAVVSPDAEEQPDGGTELDAALPPDAETPDAVAVDAGGGDDAAVVDTGALEDAGLAPDAAPADSGLKTDAEPILGFSGGGCACSASQPSRSGQSLAALAIWAVLGLTLLRPRRRSHPKVGGER